MHDFLMSLISWGTDAVVWVQGFRTPALDIFFKAVTFLGEEEFYILALSFIYWLINKPLGIRLAFASLSGVYLNNGLKDLFYTPRPDPLRVDWLVEETTYAFPSGHAQNSTVLFGFLATHIRRWLVWVATVLLILGVALSRVYLGVHYPQDLLGGALIGAVYLVLFLWLAKPVGAWIGRQTLAIRLGLAFLVPTLLVLLHPTEHTSPSMATLAGFGVANVLEAKWIRFKTSGPWPQRALRFAVGIVLIVIVFFGLREVLPEGLVYTFARYGGTGLTTGLLIPWVFVKTGLAASEGGE
jgi:membrane-associated phospholipid phosphatase